MEGKQKIISIVTLVIAMVIGLALTPSIQESVNDVTDDTNGSGYGSNLTGAGFSLIGLVPLLYVVVMIALPLAAIWKVLGS